MMKIINSAFTHDEVDAILKANKKEAGVLNLEEAAYFLDRICICLIRIVACIVVLLTLAVWNGEKFTLMEWLNRVISFMSGNVQSLANHSVRYWKGLILIGLLGTFFCAFVIKITDYFCLFDWLFSLLTRSKRNRMPIALSKTNEIKAVYKTLDNIKSYVTALHEHEITDYQITTSDARMTLILSYHVSSNVENEYIDVDHLAKIKNIRHGGFQMERKFFVGSGLKKSVISDDTIDFRKLDEWYGLDRAEEMYHIQTPEKSKDKVGKEGK